MARPSSALTSSASAASARLNCPSAECRSKVSTPYLRAPSVTGTHNSDVAPSMVRNGGPSGLGPKRHLVGHVGEQEGLPGLVHLVGRGARAGIGGCHRMR